MGQQQQHYNQQQLWSYYENRGNPQHPTKSLFNAKKSMNKCNHVQHQGILKLSQVPFPFCSQIQSNLYIQSNETTLYSLLEARLNTMKLFTQQDITKLLESVVYTLAYLETKNIVYKDLHPENIYYDDESISFKLFPPTLLTHSSYELAVKQLGFRPLSPELIIALRYHESNIQDDIYHKSNIFMFGMILLQTLCLLPSSDCYDQETFDILDKIISSRLDLVKQHYSEKLHKIIVIMLDYDYSQRPSLAELAILINNQLNQTKKINTQIKNNIVNNHSNIHKTKTKVENYKNQTDIYYNNIQQIISPKVNHTGNIGRILVSQKQNLINLSPNNLSLNNNSIHQQEQQTESIYRYPFNGKKKESLVTILDSPMDNLCQYQYNKYYPQNQELNSFTIKQYSNSYQKDYTILQTQYPRKNSFHQHPNKNYQQKISPQPSRKNSKNTGNRLPSPQPNPHQIYIQKSQVNQLQENKHNQMNNLPYTLAFNNKTNYNKYNNLNKNNSEQHQQTSKSRLSKRQPEQPSIQQQLQNQILPTFPKSHLQQQLLPSNLKQLYVLKPSNKYPPSKDHYGQQNLSQKYLNMKNKCISQRINEKYSNINNNHNLTGPYQNNKYEQNKSINRGKSTQRKYDYTNQLEDFQQFQRQKSKLENRRLDDNIRNDISTNNEGINNYNNYNIISANNRSNFPNDDKYFDHKQIEEQEQQSLQDESISRIKQQIQRSRQMIENFNQQQYQEDYYK